MYKIVPLRKSTPLSDEDLQYAVKTLWSMYQSDYHEKNNKQNPIPCKWCPVYKNQ